MLENSVKAFLEVALQNQTIEISNLPCLSQSVSFQLRYMHTNAHLKQFIFKKKKKKIWKKSFK